VEDRCFANVPELVFPRSLSPTLFLSEASGLSGWCTESLFFVHGPPNIVTFFLLVSFWTIYIPLQRPADFSPAILFGECPCFCRCFISVFASSPRVVPPFQARPLPAIGRKSPSQFFFCTFISPPKLSPQEDWFRWTDVPRPRISQCSVQGATSLHPDHFSPRLEENRLFDLIFFPKLKLRRKS